MEYIVAGYTIVNDVNFADGSSVNAFLGGSAFSVAGIKMWRDSIGYVGIGGEDFMETHGEFYTKNNIALAVEERFPKTLHYVLNYFEDGSWEEICPDGGEYEDMVYDNSRFGADAFAAFTGEDTKGIYIEATLGSQIVYEFDKLKEMIPNGKIMWEIFTSELVPEKYDDVIELIGHVDYFSMNFNEAKTFFGVETLEEAIERIKAIGKPCFFRCGDKGAYVVTPDEVTFLASMGVENCVDETGCGNCSTAASLIGLCEGLPAKETLAMANISAMYNTKQYGPWPYTDEKIRAEVEKLKADILK